MIMRWIAASNDWVKGADDGGIIGFYMFLPESIPFRDLT